MGGIETQKPEPEKARKMQESNTAADAEKATRNTQEAGRRAAEASLDEMETQEIDQPIKNLDKLTKDYPEVNPAKYKDIVAEALKDVKEKAGKAGNIHGARFEMTAEDGHEYIYIRDNTRTPSDRLFRSEKPVTSVENEYASANLEKGYTEITGDMARRIAKAAENFRQFKGNPPVANLYIEDLVNNRILTAKEGEEIDGDLAYLIKMKGKPRVFLGYAK